MARTRSEVAQGQVEELSDQERSASVETHTISIEDQLTQARIENERLKQLQELKDLQSQNRSLASGADRDATPSLRRDSVAPSEIVGPTIKAKTIRPEKMRSYKGSNEGEHLRWFREVNVKFLMSPEYFTTDNSRVIYCMQSLEGDAATQWYQYWDASAAKAQITFDQFKQFMLDLVADPANRRLLAYERFEEAKQKPDQKVTHFKAYLEDIEAQLPQFPEEIRANMFLAKLKPDLKNKILSTGNVPKLREEILAQAIMQESTLGRGRAGGGSGGNNSGHSSGQGGSFRGSQGRGKPKSGGQSHSNTLDNRVTKPNQRAGSGANKGAKGAQSTSQVICYKCNKPGHYADKCPENDKPAVGAVAANASKNDEAPAKPRGRSKKNDK